ncbi:hypothetical protein CTAYLR_010196 [Chrysophaeum taylorii]|uniref:CobW/HypB/UreG nucleotide-binding domain-containing protein n=1 Tax=Chrysophaeum taylorii TaxID=2483200 RepID=A0AAD7XNS7_9STRA|nr:hypothetical protein CTAYLR_010196 [Chrysophaeum taylorii]
MVVSKEAIIVTGPPGSGKGSFVAAVVERAGAHAIKVVRHRFAQEFGMLSETLEGATDEAAVYDFGSGCACCSPRGDFERAIQGFEGLLIVETTGLASPGLFRRASKDCFGATRVAVVAVVDRELDDSEDSIVRAAKEQIKAADVIFGVVDASLAPRARMCRELDSAVAAAFDVAPPDDDDDVVRQMVDRAPSLVFLHDARATCAVALIDDPVDADKAMRLVERYAADPRVWRVKLTASTREGLGDGLFGCATRSFPTRFWRSRRDSGTFGDWDPERVASRVFVVASIGFDVARLREDLVAAAVPDGFCYACDLDIDLSASTAFCTPELVVVRREKGVTALRRKAACGCDLGRVLGGLLREQTLRCPCGGTIFDLDKDGLDVFQLYDGAIYVATVPIIIADR